MLGDKIPENLFGNLLIRSNCNRKNVHSKFPHVFLDSICHCPIWYVLVTCGGLHSHTSHILNTQKSQVANGYCIGQHRYKIFPSSKVLLGITASHREVLELQKYVCACMFLQVAECGSYSCPVGLLACHSVFERQFAVPVTGLEAEIMFRKLLVFIESVTKTFLDQTSVRLL